MNAKLQWFATWFSLDEFVQIKLRDITRVARPQYVGHWRADLLKHLRLNLCQLLRIVAQYSGHGHLPDFSQLAPGESQGLPRVWTHIQPLVVEVVKEPVAQFEPGKRVSYDALEHWAQNRVLVRFLQKSADKKVWNIIELDELCFFLSHVQWQQL